MDELYTGYGITSDEFFLIKQEVLFMKVTSEKKQAVARRMQKYWNLLKQMIIKEEAK